MTAVEARAIYLAFPEAIEGAHFDRADFRIKDKIFATLWEDGTTTVLRLPADFGAGLAEVRPDVFSIKSKAGKWLWLGVNLPSVDNQELRDLAEMAFAKRREG